jgi:predicted choloylglycine hydrolase
MPLFRSLITCLVTTALALIGGCAEATRRVEPVAAVQQEEPFPTPVVVLRGDDAELGSQHGQQLGEQIRFLNENYLTRYLRTDAQRFAAAAAAMLFEARIAPNHRAEIESLASATGIDQRQVMLGQCFLDLTAMQACSTLALPASASPDGVARFGRNLDFPGFNIADKNTVVLVFHPKDRYAFAAVSWPGLIGVLSGMNEHGLTLANMEVTRGPRFPTAMPYTLLYRTILEKCRTVDEAIKLLQETPRQTDNNLMLMDASGDRAVVEIAPDKITVRRADDQHALISTNHRRGNGDGDSDGSTPPTVCRRYDTLRDLSAERFGSIDRASIQQMLSAASQGSFTLQSMIFEPSDRVLYLATGADAPAGRFYLLDLKPYFKKL